MEPRQLLSAPVVDTFTADLPSPITVGLQVTLQATAHDTAPDTISAVRFYDDVNGDAQAESSELIGSDLDGSDGWSLVWNTKGHAAEDVTLLAVAEDPNKKVSPPMSLALTLVSNINNAPPTDLFLSSTSVPEGQPAGTPVGTFSTIDADDPDSFTYSFVSGAGDTDNSAFTINNGQLLTAQSFVFATQSRYSVRVRTTDEGGLTYDKALTIYITEVNKPPVVSGFSKSVTTGTTLAFTVADFTGHETDPDFGNLLRKVKITALPTNGTLKLGSAAVTLNQEILAADLVTLTYTPNGGTSDSFSWSGSDGKLYSLSSASVNVTIAQPARLILDDGDHGFTTTGVWRTATGSGYQNDYRYPSGTGSHRATWCFTGLTSGYYRVSVTWPSSKTNASNATFTVLDGTKKVGAVLVNERGNPADLTDAGKKWLNLGGKTKTWKLTGTKLVVWLTDSGANGRVLADAVRIQRISSLSGKSRVSRDVPEMPNIPAAMAMTAPASEVAAPAIFASELKILGDGSAGDVLGVASPAGQSEVG